MSRGAGPKDGNETPPGGFYNMFEMLFEGLMGFVGGIAGGRHFRLIFNMFMTIFLVVLMANWMELVPGVDTIGFMHPHVKEKYDPVADKYKVVTTDGFEIYQGFLGFSYVNAQCDWISPAAEAAADQTALANAEAARATALQAAAVDAAYARYKADHGENGDGDDDHAEAAVESDAGDAAYNEALGCARCRKASATRPQLLYRRVDIVLGRGL